MNQKLSQEILVSRSHNLYSRNEDARSPYTRDYTRILHCNAFRRLKHKTQVFYDPDNDHICTRIEHVLHVESVSYSIASAMGFNVELTKAISAAHDLGHAPFGHFGETVLSFILYDNPLITDVDNKEIPKLFWHEKHGLRVVEKLEFLPDTKDQLHNLDLTYAVRDGIICHCGEIDEAALYPRSDFQDLDSMTKPGQFSPCTWEGCVVKIADKMSFFGRDIEDAKLLGLFDGDTLSELKSMLQSHTKRIAAVNNTELIGILIRDLLTNSSIDKGLTFSSDTQDFMKVLREFSYKHIYTHNRVESYKKYAYLVLTQLYRHLIDEFEQEAIFEKLKTGTSRYFGFYDTFCEWLYDRDMKRCNDERDLPIAQRGNVSTPIYDCQNSLKDYKLAVVDFIAGMTDGYAIKCFNMLLKY